MTAPENSVYTGPDEFARAMLLELSDVLAEFIDECVLIGGMARNFWSEPRYTKDIDFTLVAEPRVFARLRQKLEAVGYVIARIQEEHEPSGPGFVRFVKPGTKKIVEFLTAKTEFQDLLIQRGIRISPDQPFRVATPEDVIVLKLIANRSQDQKDTIVLGSAEDIDWDYIARWATEWGVGDRVPLLRSAIEHDRELIADLYSDTDEPEP